MKKVGIIFLIVGILIVAGSVSHRLFFKQSVPVKVMRRDRTYSMQPTSPSRAPAAVEDERREEAVEPRHEPELVLSTSSEKKSFFIEVLGYLKEILGSVSSIAGLLIVLNQRRKPA